MFWSKSMQCPISIHFTTLGSLSSVFKWRFAKTSLLLQSPKVVAQSRFLSSHSNIVLAFVLFGNGSHSAIAEMKRDLWDWRQADDAWNHLSWHANANDLQYLLVCWLSGSAWPNIPSSVTDVIRGVGIFCKWIVSSLWMAKQGERCHNVPMCTFEGSQWPCNFCGCCARCEKGLCFETWNLFNLFPTRASLHYTL